ncbi:MAG: putative nucleotidyltransferase substrate binding domain-containing protein, partial [Hyphomicrobiaceae bacterium]
ATRERLEAVKALGKVSPRDIDAVIEAHETLLAVVLDQQIEDAQRGVALTPRVAVERLDAKGRARLKSALGAIESLLGVLSEGRL